MITITKETEKYLLNHPFGSTDGQGVRAKIIAHYHNPVGTGDWYVTEAEKQDDDIRFYGWVDFIEQEYGYFTLSELNKAIPWLEEKNYYLGKTVEELLKDIERVKCY